MKLTVYALTVTQRYQYAHPNAKASESSMNRSAYSVNEPETGIMVAISPNDCLESVQNRLRPCSVSPYMTKNTMVPTSEKLMRIPAGPPWLSALPDPTNSPGPMIP